MNLGSSDMAGSALGTALSLLLLAYFIQGLQDVEVFHYEKMEAVVGQDVVLPCTVRSRTNLTVGNIEWRKNRNGNIKLAVYNANFGLRLFRPNITVRIENNSMGSHLHLFGVTQGDGDVYICDMATFPLGSFSRETELKIKDAEIICNMNTTIDVQAGENVTVKCRALPNAQYRWFKDKKIMSENESLDLLWATDSDSGVYTLSVNTGNKRLHKEFIITVLTATTSLRTDAMASPQSHVTDSIPTTSPTAGLSTIDTNETWTSSQSNHSSNPGSVTISHTHISVTSSPTTRTHFSSSSDRETNPPTTFSTSTFAGQSAASNASATLDHGKVTFAPTQRTTHELTRHTVQPEGNSSTSPEESSKMGRVTENSHSPDANTTQRTGNELAIEDDDPDGVRSHLLLVLILIIAVLVLIAVAAFLHRKKMIKQRMDQPPPFKPPPPPVKYTAAIRSEISRQPFPVSRCNSEMI